jgi:hypothetical protein
MILQLKDNLGRYPLILGRPWLAIAYANISCRSGDMTISHGNSTKKLTLYPSGKPSLDSETPSWVEYNVEEVTQPLLSLEHASLFARSTKDDLIKYFMIYLKLTSAYPSLECVIKPSSQENYSLEEMEEKMELEVPVDISLSNQSTTIEVHPGKTLNINSHLNRS